MASIPFMQYIRPDGRQSPMLFDTDDPEQLSGAARILARGWRFEAEVLTTGDVSLTISNGDFDVACVISENGPEIDDRITQLIRAGVEILDGEKSSRHG